MAFLARRDTGAGRVNVVSWAFASLLVAVCVAHHVTTSQPYPAHAMFAWSVGIAVTAVLCGVLALLPARTITGAAESMLALVMKPSAAVFAVIVAVIATGIAAFFSGYLFAHAPTTADELAQLWHAKILTHGHLSLTPDPNPEFFAIDNVVDSGRWYSEYPIGGPAVLVPGILLGATWIINPVFTGIAAAAIYAFARRAFTEVEGRVIAILFALTPPVLMMGGSHMNHVPVLMLDVVALAALVAWDLSSVRVHRAAYAGAVGSALGLMATIRPLDGVIATTGIAMFMLFRAATDRTRARDLCVAFIATLVALMPLLYANHATTGNAFRFGYEALWGAGHSVGFHTDPFGVEHTLSRGLRYVTTYVSELNVFLLMAPLPGLLLVLCGLFSKRCTRWDALLIALFMLQAAAYGAYWHDGQFVGPRFLFTALPALIVFVARSPFVVSERFGPRAGAIALIVLTVVVSAGWVAPGNTVTVRARAAMIRDSRQVMKVDVARDVRAAGVHDAVVFVREPFGTRLLHRLWGIGMTRGDAARLFARSDACSLLAAVRRIESQNDAHHDVSLAHLSSVVQPFQRGDSVLRAADPTLLISSRASLTNECVAEVEHDRDVPGAPFGPLLPLEPINGSQMDGDVIFAADLGERNEILRKRFGTRTWMRLSIAKTSRGELHARLAAY